MIFLPDKLREAPEVYMIDDRSHSINVLGIKYIPFNDHFTSMRQPFDAREPTKRQILSDIARLYDPIGQLAPAIIGLKLLIQETWLAGVTWDQFWLQNREKVECLESSLRGSLQHRCQAERPCTRNCGQQ